MQLYDIGSFSAAAHEKKGMSQLMGLKRFLGKLIWKMRDWLALMCLLLVYYVYAELCYLIVGHVGYLKSVILFGTLLFGGVMGLIYLHDYLKARYDWDAMKLQYLNSLRMDPEVEIEPHRVYLRAMRFVLQKGYWAILLIGPLLLGPFLVTLLLRKQKTWLTNAAYTLFGALYNAFITVALAKGAVALALKYFG